MYIWDVEQKDCSFEITAKTAMAKNLELFSLLFTLFLLSSQSSAIVTPQELQSAIAALQYRGYSLFGNSIAVSDLSYQILSPVTATTTAATGSYRGRGGQFTLLAPPNSALFSLDMSTDAVSYVNSLRCHVIPRRLIIDDLRNLSLSSKPYLKTLVHNRVLFVANRMTETRSSSILAVPEIVEYFTVDGVRIAFPNLFLGPNIVVHGLDGIISSPDDFNGTLGFVPPLMDHRHSSLDSGSDLASISPILSPIGVPSPDISEIDTIPSQFLPDVTSPAISPPDFVNQPPFGSADSEMRGNWSPMPSQMDDNHHDHGKEPKAEEFEGDYYGRSSGNVEEVAERDHYRKSRGKGTKKSRHHRRHFAKDNHHHTL